jgi:hypothetical protein
MQYIENLVPSALLEVLVTGHCPLRVMQMTEGCYKCWLNGLEGIL